ncbi:c-type cytochrome [Telmatospirillum siberiense]|uniref:Alcohol dehydrogenase n=1 Tax=Telmatospirillum siberiense TaxID=382514 RepID=A0A2N3PUG7_9PROT|nr:cytochrome c [Telmatospirillum siberiense]PKU24036.1 alcohol dehydrogenase [Telmatospirillum siberiense]
MRKLLSVLLPVIVLAAAGVTWFATRVPSSPFDGVAGSQAPSPELIQRGEYIARLADCVGCHGSPDQPPFTGGLEMATPVGSIFATNITPDKETGIGNYSLADFDRAVRHDVARDGHHLYPAMPYPSYAKLSDDDVRALYAYFMHGVKPARHANKASDIPWPLSIRWPLAFWSALFMDHGSHHEQPSENAVWNRGAYLVQGPGHCGACHTPRGLAFNERALDDSNPLFLSGALLDGWYAPSLRGDPNRGLGRWSEDELHQFLKTGRNRHAVVFGSMTDAFNNSTQFMTDEDLRAIAHYLKSLPGDPRRDGPAWHYDPKSNDTLALNARLKTPGAQTFLAKCSFCHGADGRGQGQWFPPLAGAASLMARENASSINVTLNGSKRVVADGIPDAYRMPPFREQLSDRQIADVLSFARSSWGNNGEPVKPEEVKHLRESTDPANSSVIILHMR